MYFSVYIFKFKCVCVKGGGQSFICTVIDTYTIMTAEHFLEVDQNFYSDVGNPGGYTSVSFYTYMQLTACLNFKISCPSSMAYMRHIAPVFSYILKY